MSRPYSDIIILECLYGLFHVCLDGSNSLSPLEVNSVRTLNINAYFKKGDIYFNSITPVATGYTKIKIFSVHFSTLSTLNVCHRRKFLSYQTGLNYPWKDKHINLIKRVNIDNEVAQYLGNVN